MLLNVSTFFRIRQFNQILAHNIYKKNGCTLFVYAGFRPRIKRNICTFGLRLAKSNSPEATATLCSPYYKFAHKICTKNG